MTRAVNPAPTKKLETREKNPAILPGELLVGVDAGVDAGVDDAGLAASSAKVLLNCYGHEKNDFNMN